METITQQMLLDKHPKECKSTKTEDTALWLIASLSREEVLEHKKKHPKTKLCKEFKYLRSLPVFENFELLSDFECGICREIMFRPQILNCGHSFCEHCVNDWKKTCPKCRRNITSVNANKEIAAKLTSEPVTCIFSYSGCTFEGKYSTFAKHQGECPCASFVECPNKGCPWIVSRANLKEHLNTQCLFQKVTCKCGELIPKLKQKEHKRKTCPEGRSKCKGCNAFVTRKSQHYQQCTLFLQTLTPTPVTTTTPSNTNQ